MRQYRTHRILQFFTRNISELSRDHQRRPGKYSREQQGLSFGHWLLALQEAAAQAVADKASREVTKRTIVEDYVM